jgi:HAD superfamily hydrolase (TIGR01490 family)
VTPRAPYLALFDVDETLIEPKSMLSFLAFLEREADAVPLVPGAIARFTAASARARALGASRSQLNRLYYELFGGAPAAAIVAAGARWYRETRQAYGERFFVPATRAALLAHAAAGAEIVLVSGSFAPCLDPLVAELAAALGDAVRLTVLSARLRIRAGIYTGNLRPPQTIGIGKRVAAAALARRRPGVELGRCHAYGDHISDLPLLELVGHPHVVPRCPELAAVARERGWPVLALDPGPIAAPASAPTADTVSLADAP